MEITNRLPSHHQTLRIFKNKNINKMKITKSNNPVMKMSTVAALFIALFLFASCGTSKYNFSTSSVVPAAEGKVKVKKDGNSNYKISLDIMRLAEPQRLNPSKAMYVVWMETEQNGSKNIGQLKTSSGFLSKTLKSSLTTVTSFKPTGFFITAEDDASIQYPGGQVVLSTGSSY